MVRRLRNPMLLCAVQLLLSAQTVTVALPAQPSNEDLYFKPLNLKTLPRFGENFGGGVSENYVLSPAAPSYIVNNKLEFQLPWNAGQHSFLIGPEFHMRVSRRISVNAWALGGKAKRFALMEPLVSPTDATPPHFGLPGSPINQSPFNGANGFTESFGGSADFHITDHLIYRLAQAEYLRVRVSGRNVDDRRLSTGIRFSFGK